MEDDRRWMSERRIASRDTEAGALPSRIRQRPAVREQRLIQYISGLERRERLFGAFDENVLRQRNGRAPVCFARKSEGFFLHIPDP